MVISSIINLIKNINQFDVLILLSGLLVICYLRLVFNIKEKTVDIIFFVIIIGYITLTSITIFAYKKAFIILQKYSYITVAPLLYFYGPKFFKKFIVSSSNETCIKDIIMLIVFSLTFLSALFTKLLFNIN